MEYLSLAFSSIARYCGYSGLQRLSDYHIYHIDWECSKPEGYVLSLIRPKESYSKAALNYFLLYVVGCSGNPAKFVIRRLVVLACNRYRLIRLWHWCHMHNRWFLHTVYLGQQSVVVVMMFGTDAILVGVFLYGSDQPPEPITHSGAYCTAASGSISLVWLPDGCYCIVMDWFLLRCCACQPRRNRYMIPISFVLTLSVRPEVF